jgi:hypothetical protein
MEQSVEHVPSPTAAHLHGRGPEDEVSSSPRSHATENSKLGDGHFLIRHGFARAQQKSGGGGRIYTNHLDSMCVGPPGFGHCSVR